MVAILTDGRLNMETSNASQIRSTGVLRDQSFASTTRVPRPKTDIRRVTASNKTPEQELTSKAVDPRSWIADASRISGLTTWSGRILEINGEEFTAELQSGEGSDSYVADFDTDQLGVGEVPTPGDLVYVTVRKVLDPRGRPRTTSSVRLRRLGKWTHREVRAHRERGLAMKQLLDGLT
ncbi:hypothetical protein [Frondihabitans peucedani]|uniref:S1 motif domain-containing protein n=1 Tax=Frondihabitans peucedani TaxID=598626 RepID=A0ABP8E1H5_9MICO